MLALGTQYKVPCLFMCGRFSISGRVLGAVGGGSCSLQNGGPSNIKVELLSDSGDVVSSVSTSSEGSYLFKNIIPGTKVELLYIITIFS